MITDIEWTSREKVSQKSKCFLRPWHGLLMGLLVLIVAHKDVVSEANRIGRERARPMRFTCTDGGFTASYAGRQESQVPIGDNLPHGGNRGTIFVPSRILRQLPSLRPNAGQILINTCHGLG